MAATTPLDGTAAASWERDDDSRRLSTSHRLKIPREDIRRVPWTLGETGKESSHHKEMPRQRWEMDPPPPRTAGQASARMNAE